LTYVSRSFFSAMTTQTSTLVTFTNFNPVKLTMDNYPLWLPQIVPHLKGGNLYGYVDGSIPCPPPTIPTTNDVVDSASTTTDAAASSTSPNPAYQIWQMQDQIILGAINSSLYKKLLIHVLAATLRAKPGLR
jgi:hypothetical protein